MIQPERIRALNGLPDRRGRFVLYWMQASQRAEDNHALELAVRAANERRLPLAVLFVLTNFPEANARHRAFLREGIAEVRDVLARRGICCTIQEGRPEDVVPVNSREAALLVTDRGYLRIQRAWRDAIAASVSCPMVEVETDVIVPVETAASGEAWSAAVLRPRIHRHLDRFLMPLRETEPLRDGHVLDALFPRAGGKDGLPAPAAGEDGVPPVAAVRGGARAAKRRLETFVREGLPLYDRRKDPARHVSSRLGPYLHFGQISPLTVALRVGAETDVPAVATDAFLEELIVRRELSMNFVRYNPGYDRYEQAVPAWARQTLAVHGRDRSLPAYAAEDWEAARTGDPYWNAAQTELARTGSIHNTLRMYWGKKLLEWSESPEEAFRTALRLNNKYALDGRDPNSYAGVAWCFGKHDRPWPERPVFGKVRSLTAAGLERKYDMVAYVRRVAGEEAP